MSEEIAKSNKATEFVAQLEPMNVSWLTAQIVIHSEVNHLSHNCDTSGFNVDVFYACKNEATQLHTRPNEN